MLQVTALALCLFTTPGPLGASTLPAATRGPGSAAWDGRSRVVHEWGTFTAVLGSDGVALDGLRHEDGSLPGFVLDAADAFALTAASPKMETPVIYFYSPEPWYVRVRAAFPHGAITHWYPPASQVNGLRFAGPVEMPRPALPLRDGSITWGHGAELCVLARDEQPALPAVAADDPWSFARDVAANTVRVDGLAQTEAGIVPRASCERFLFYRGLGDFDLPVRAEVETARVEGDVARVRASFAGTDGTLRSPFLVFVDGERAGFVRLADLGARAHAVDATLELRPRAEVERDLVERVACALSKSGLFADEALAMARTWRHAWFGEPGLRLVALLPREFVDRELPLEVGPVTVLTREGVREGPGADEVVRAFVARIELLSPERERGLRDTLQRAERGDPDAQARASAWGRFRAPFEARVAELFRR